MIARHNRRTFNRIFGAFHVVSSCVAAALQMTRQRPFFFDQIVESTRIIFGSRLTNNAKIDGNAIAAATSGVGLDLGDNARVVKRCVTGGGAIAIVSSHPAKCLRGEDTSGTGPLLTELSSGISDAGTLATTLFALTANLTVPEIDVASETKQTMDFPAGTNVVAVTTEILSRAPPN